MRQLILNLLTLSLMIGLLAALTLPAVSSLGSPDDDRRARPSAPIPHRPLGAVVDPWHVDDWGRDVGTRPVLLGTFEAFSRHRTLDLRLREMERRGISRLMVSWEPWRPVPAALGRLAQFRPQPGYRNADVAAGAQDAYISRFARSIAGFDGIVYLRYAHEMNGIWYPWTHDATAYRRAWRRVVGLFEDAGADNVRFVWSANPNLYETPRTWLRKLRRYWPGDRYVDAVGSTMIDFGGQKDYPVARFAPRLRRLIEEYGKPLVLTEVNTDYAGRVGWLRDLRRMLARMPAIRWLMWSQLPSRGKVQMPDAGKVDWDVRRDPPAAAVLRGIAHDGRERG